MPSPVKTDSPARGLGVRIPAQVDTPPPTSCAGSGVFEAAKPSEDVVHTVSVRTSLLSEHDPSVTALWASKIDEIISTGTSHSCRDSRDSQCRVQPTATVESSDFVPASSDFVPASYLDQALREQHVQMASSATQRASGAVSDPSDVEDVDEPQGDFYFIKNEQTLHYEINYTSRSTFEDLSWVTQGLTSLSRASTQRSRSRRQQQYFT